MNLDLWSRQNWRSWKVRKVEQKWRKIELLKISKGDHKKI